MAAAEVKRGMSGALLDVTLTAAVALCAFTAGFSFSRSNAHRRAADAFDYLATTELAEPITHVHVANALDIAAGLKDHG